MGLFVTVSVLCVLAFVVFFRSPASKYIVLDQKLEQGSSRKPKVEVGLKGVSKTDLRPTGKAVFVLDSREKQIDVVTNGEFVKKDQPIEVVEIEGNRIVVNEKV